MTAACTFIWTTVLGALPFISVLKSCRVLSDLLIGTFHSHIQLKLWTQPI